MSGVMSSIKWEFQKYKTLGDLAISQLQDPELSRPAGPGTNTVTTLVWHLSGSLLSRFTDFLTTDGEKPWRDRPREFQPREISREALVARWEDGWRVLFASLDTISEADFDRIITIEAVEHRVDQALQRAVCHAAYHVGQIVFLAKLRRGLQWKDLKALKAESEAS